MYKARSPLFAPIFSKKLVILLQFLPNSEKKELLQDISAWREPAWDFAVDNKPAFSGISPSRKTNIENKKSHNEAATSQIFNTP